MSEACTDSKAGSLLHAYELGVLEESDLDVFEQHLLVCDFCFQSLQAWEPGVSLLRRDPSFAKAASAAVREHNRERRPSWWARLWPREWPLLLRPGVSYLAALSLFVVLLVTHPWEFGSSVREPQVIYLASARDVRTGEYALDPTEPLVITFHVDGRRGDRSYAVSLTRNGSVIFTESSLKHLDKLGTGTLLLPPGMAEPGDYRLVLVPSESTANTGDTLSIGFRVVSPHP